MKNIVAAAVAVLAVTGATCDDPPPERSRLADCTTGPWADHCPEARWAREVAAAAGFEVTGDTGAALEIRGSGADLYLWAFTPEEPTLRSTQLEDEGYRPKATIAGVTVFGDGQRLTWKTYGLHVWLESMRRSAVALTTPGVRDVVRASTEVPWP